MSLVGPEFSPEFSPETDEIERIGCCGSGLRLCVLAESSHVRDEFFIGHTGQVTLLEFTPS